jgi:hypothetical protein
MSIHWGGRGAGHVSRWSTATTGVPALDLNFLSGTLDSRVAFSRASTATVIDSSGTIQTSAVNSPRFDFDPVTLTQRGLLIEEPRTNLFTTSLISGVPLVTQSVSVTAVPHTLSFYGTGTITLSGASVATVTGTGVYPNRRTITFTPILGVLVCTVVGTVQFAQLEVGSFATSFIPTGASPVARSADVANMTGTNFSSWYNQSEGTFMLTGSIFANQGATTVDFLQASDGLSNSIAIELAMFDLAFPFFAVSNTTTQASLDLGTLTLNSVFNMIGAYKVNDFAGTMNGGSVQTDTSGTVPSGIVQLGIGNRLSGTYMNGHIRRIAYYNTRLSNAKLQTLTQ